MDLSFLKDRWMLGFFKGLDQFGFFKVVGSNGFADVGFRDFWILDLFGFSRIGSFSFADTKMVNGWGY